MIGESDKFRLFDAAVKVIKNAYSPYSKVKVAAAILDERGSIYTGVNVENASFGLTVCAERNAIFKAVGEGAKSVEAILITSTIGAIPPCGACRQVLAEFAKPETPIFLANADNIKASTTLGELLPRAFFLKSEK